MNLLKDGLSSLLLETAHSKAIHYLELHDEDYQMLWMKYQNRFDYAQDYN